MNTYADFSMKDGKYYIDDVEVSTREEYERRWTLTMALRLALEESDVLAPRTLEDEVERRHVTHLYIIALMEEVKALTLYEAGSGVQTGMVWALIRATPEQRARAFLEVIHEQ